MEELKVRQLEELRAIQTKIISGENTKDNIKKQKVLEKVLRSWPASKH